jgi:hypothetical protein
MPSITCDGHRKLSYKAPGVSLPPLPATSWWLTPQRHVCPVDVCQPSATLMKCATTCMLTAARAQWPAPVANTACCRSIGTRLGQPYQRVSDDAAAEMYAYTRRGGGGSCKNFQRTSLLIVLSCDQSQHSHNHKRTVHSPTLIGADPDTPTYRKSLITVFVREVI